MGVNELGGFTFDNSFFLRALMEISNQMIKLPKTTVAVTKTISKSFMGAFNIIKKSSVSTFNVIKNFGGGVKKVFGGFGKIIGGIKDRFSGLGGSGKDMAKGMVSAMSNMAIKASLVAVAIKGIKTVLSEMPEVGKAFGMVKDIMLKNFLFPIRKAIFPYLQKLLDWARDNRTQFVKWGQSLVNVFGSVIRHVKTVVQMAKTLAKSFSGVFENIFGVPIGNIQEMFDVLSFKAAVVLAFVQKMFSKFMVRATPILQTVGTVIQNLIGAWKNLMGGLLSGFLSIDKKVDIFKELNKVFQAFNKLIIELSPLLRPLGNLLGKIFGTALVMAFRTLESVLLTVTDLIKVIKGDLSGGDFWKGIKESFGNIGKGLFGGKNQKSVNDAIIKPDGSVIKTHPSDTIIATKNSANFIPKPESKGSLSDYIVRESIANSKSSKKVDISIDFTGMNLNIQEATSEEAARFSVDVVSLIRDRLSKELEFMGV